MEGKKNVYHDLSLPVVGGGVGAAVVVVGFGLLAFLVQRIVHFPPLEGFFPSVTTLMLKSPFTLALYFPFFPLQSLINSTWLYNSCIV